MIEPLGPVQIIHSVLVVEDDYELAELLREVLTLENCTVDVAGNGLEALDRLSGATYDAVICDLLMPCVDGRALYEQVCQQYPHLSERFLFITGQAVARTGLTDFIYRTGNPLLQKPFAVEELRAALRDLLSR